MKEKKKPKPTPGAFGKFRRPSWKQSKAIAPFLEGPPNETPNYKRQTRLNRGIDDRGNDVNPPKSK